MPKRTELSAEQERELVAALSVRGPVNVSAVARRFGMSRGALLNFVARHPWLEQHIEYMRDRFGTKYELLPDAEGDDDVAITPPPPPQFSDSRP